jgi:hypothetical protein
VRRVVVLGVALVTAAASAAAARAATPREYVLHASDLPGWVVKKTETTPASAGGVFASYGLL